MDTDRLNRQINHWCTDAYMWYDKQSFTVMGFTKRPLPSPWLHQSPHEALLVSKYGDLYTHETKTTQNNSKKHIYIYVYKQINIE